MVAGNTEITLHLFGQIETKRDVDIPHLLAKGTDEMVMGVSAGVKPLF
jgi:hypothetical protein